MTNKDEIREDNKYKKLNFMLDRLVKGVDYVGDPDLSYTLDLEEFTHVELLQLILNYFSEYNDSRLSKVVEELEKKAFYTHPDRNISNDHFRKGFRAISNNDELVIRFKDLKSLLNETKEK